MPAIFSLYRILESIELEGVFSGLLTQKLFLAWVVLFLWCFVLFIMDDLTHLWKNFTLTEDESCAMEASVQGLHHIVDRGKTCLVGKLLADRLIGKNAIRSTLIKGWRPAGNTSFTNLGDNLFLIEFEHFWDKDLVLEGRPWVFEGNLFSVEEFNGTVAPSSLEFDKVLFWVRMFQLPLSCMSETMGVQLGRSVGQVVEVETEEDGVGWGEYLRVRIRVDLSKPLVRGRMLKLNGTSIWIAFQYEKLLKFCFQCGMVRHGLGGCLNLREVGKKGILPQMQFGVWLRADGFGQRPRAGGSTRLFSSGVPDSQSGAISGNVLGKRYYSVRPDGSSGSRHNQNSPNTDHQCSGSRPSGGAVEPPVSGLALHVTVPMQETVSEVPLGDTSLHVLPQPFFKKETVMPPPVSGFLQAGPIEGAISSVVNVHDVPCSGANVVLLGNNVEQIVASSVLHSPDEDTFGRLGLGPPLFSWQLLFVLLQRTLHLLHWVSPALSIPLFSMLSRLHLLHPCGNVRNLLDVPVMGQLLHFRLWGRGNRGLLSYWLTQFLSKNLRQWQWLMYSPACLNEYP
jgi:hypothetical protein